MEEHLRAIAKDDLEGVGGEVFARVGEVAAGDDAVGVEDAAVFELDGLAQADLGDGTVEDVVVGEERSADGLERPSSPDLRIHGQPRFVEEALRERTGQSAPIWLSDPSHQICLHHSAVLRPSIQVSPLQGRSDPRMPGNGGM